MSLCCVSLSWVSWHLSPYVSKTSDLTDRPNLKSKARTGMNKKDFFGPIRVVESSTSNSVALVSSHCSVLKQFRVPLILNPPKKKKKNRLRVFVFGDHFEGLFPGFEGGSGHLLNPSRRRCYKTLFLLLCWQVLFSLVSSKARTKLIGSYFRYSSLG